MIRGLQSLAGAQGWYAVLDWGKGEGNEIRVPLVAWALKPLTQKWAEAGDQSVVGLISMPGDGIVEAPDYRGFVFYEHESLQPR